MTGIVIAIIVVVVFARLPKILARQQAIARGFEPVPLADRRPPMPAWFEDEPDDQIASDEIAPAAAPARPAGRTHYLLGGAPASGTTDRMRATMDVFAGPGVCTPRKRRAP